MKANERKNAHEMHTTKKNSKKHEKMHWVEKKSKENCIYLNNERGGVSRAFRFIYKQQLLIKKLSVSIQLLQSEHHTAVTLV